MKDGELKAYVIIYGFFLLPGIIGGLLMNYGFSLREANRVLQENGVEVRGVVVDLKYTNFGDSGTFYHYVADYEAMDGVTYTKDLDRFQYKTSIGKLGVGDSLDLIYPKGNPKDAGINTNYDMSRPWWSIIIGLGFLLASLFVVGVFAWVQFKK